MEQRQQFENNPEMYSFKDGQFNFWEGEVDGKIVVIRVREDDKPGRRWAEKGLPQGITIHPATNEHIRQWFEGHPEYKLNG